MTSTLRRLNDQGLDEFTRWLAQGGHGSVPIQYLTDPRTSEPLPTQIRVDQRLFGSRFEFGEYLGELLEPLGPSLVSHDRGLWTWLAILWFEQLCPSNQNGNRTIREHYRYVLSKSYRNYYRHLVRTPWQIVRDHGRNARFLLLSPSNPPHPLQVGGEILEQFASRQGILRSRRIIDEASRLYSDPSTGKPRTGAAGAGRGSARRLALVMQQFRLTFDPESMQPGSLIALLPKEFDRWK